MMENAPVVGRKVISGRYFAHTHTHTHTCPQTYTGIHRCYGIKRALAHATGRNRTSTAAYHNSPVSWVLRGQVYVPIYLDLSIRRIVVLSWDNYPLRTIYDDRRGGGEYVVMAARETRKMKRRAFISHKCRSSSWLLPTSTSSSTRCVPWNCRRRSGEISKSHPLHHRQSSRTASSPWPCRCCPG